MYQEVEQGIWKPVLGTLGVATVVLTLVGNVVFAPKPSTPPTLGIANSGTFNSDHSHTELTPQAGQPRHVERAPAVDLPVNTEEAIVIRPVDSQNPPCDSASDVLVADHSPLAKPEPGRDEELVAVRVDSPALPEETAGRVLVAERTPVAGHVHDSEHAPLPEQVALPEQAPKTGDEIASLPVTGPELPAEIPSTVSVADVSEESPTTDAQENREPHPYTVAAASSQPPVVVQRLSHRDRKMLRKIAHLEKKQNRLLKDDQSLVCR
jgi:hypothetical protein